ncbi:hypothetical protein DYB38_006395 [Aphanomyces astaci]|uniref:Uncharacterized protein n=1 Tax=Aphanomyces astaci TaxID=112090 RepID=A0A397DP57_APHAT|nr:hypothetical protein DYB38_006395 [Aphanomyces astaci]
MKKRSERPMVDNIDSISEFESEFHHAFLKSRLDHDDYVYKPSLLRCANWINRRKKKFQNWNNGFPEFIFYHAVEAVRRNWTTLHINPFSDDEKQMVVHKFLSRQTGRPTLHHVVLKEWLGASTMSELFEVILRSMEAGHVPSQIATSDAMLFLQEHSLDATFAWVDDGMGSPRYHDETNADVSLVFRELFEGESTNTNGGGSFGGSGGDAQDAPRQVRTSVLTATEDPEKPSERGEGGGGGIVDDGSGCSSGSDDDNHAHHHSAPAAPAAAAQLPPPRKSAPFLRHLERVKTHRNIVFPAMTAHEANIAPLDAPEVQVPADDDDGTNLAAILNDYKPARPKVPTLPETTWTTMLSALKALGCLFLQDIVLLPLCYDTLRDLLFFTANYKTELFCYWKTLTEGEFVSGSATPPPLNQPPDELDVTNTPTITTFDLVREYNKSIEDWYHSTRPTTKQLLPLLQSMTKFVFEYSVFSQSELPVFNHPHFDAKHLHANGFHFIHQFPWLALGYDIDDGDSKHMTGLVVSISPENTKDDDMGLVDTYSDSHSVTSPANNNTTTPVTSSATNNTTLPSSSSSQNISAATNASTLLSPSQSTPNLPKQRKDIIGLNSPAHTLMRRKTQYIGFKNAPTSSFPSQLKHTSDAILDDPMLHSGIGKLLAQRTAGTSVSVRDTMNDSVCSEGFGLPAHLQEYAKTEADVKRSCNQQILFKLQQAHNFLKRDANTKCNRLDKLRQKIRERRAKQTSSLQYIQEAEDALHEMTKRMDQVDATLKVVAKQEKTYIKLLGACEDYSASEKHHLAQVRKELKVLSLKLRDLQKQNQALAFEQQHLATVEFPQLAAACEDNKRLHDAVLDRLNSTKVRMAQDVANIEALYVVRKGIIDKVKSTAFDLNTNEPIELEKIMHVQATAETNAANKSQVAKAALEQCQSMCRRIVHATGLTNMAAIHEKFHNRDALNRSLDEQAALYEARLKQIKLSHSELEVQMNSLETTPKDSTDPRQLEDLARDAEAALSRTQRAYATQLHALNEVVVGVSNIARLAGITDVRKPKHALIPAADLWPPYQDKVHTPLTAMQDDKNNMLFSLPSTPSSMMQAPLGQGSLARDCGGDLGGSSLMLLDDPAEPAVATRDIIKSASKQKLAIKRKELLGRANTGMMSPPPANSSNLAVHHDTNTMDGGINSC